MNNTAIILDKNKCKVCYTCIRTCPVKAIHVQKDSIFPIVDEAKCISCGTCIKSCAYNAISHTNSKADVINLINSDQKVAAVCSPSIASEFDDITDYRKFAQMIRALGFSFVTEMSFGVDIIAEKFRKLTTDEFNGKYYLTSGCPAIVSYIEKNYPELIGNLVPYISPAGASAVIVRKTYGEGIKIVHITPCVAAKTDITRYQGNAKIDAVLTFKELRELFDEYKINETFSEFSDFDPPLGNKGNLYPIAQGFLEAARLDLSILKNNTITADGKKNSFAAIHQFSNHNKAIKHNFNLFFCEGCIMGPGSKKFGDKFLRGAFVKEYAQKRLKNLNTVHWKNELEQHIDYEEYKISFNNRRPAHLEINELDMKVALDYITSRNNNVEINCGSCGFNTCRGLAQAIAQNIATPEMCVTYSQIGNREAAYTYKKSIEELNISKSELKVTREALDDIKVQLSSKDNALSILVRSLNAGIVFTDENLKIVESNLSFIDILGEDAREIHDIIPYLVDADLKSLLPASLVSQFSYLIDHNETKVNRDVEINGKLINVSIFQLIPKKLVGAVFRNLHSEEERPEEIIHRVTEVIEENLRQVQEIGFILGEGAAKTEKMLRSIIKSYK